MGSPWLQWPCRRRTRKRRRQERQRGGRPMQISLAEWLWKAFMNVGVLPPVAFFTGWYIVPAIVRNFFRKPKVFPLLGDVGDDRDAGASDRRLSLLCSRQGDGIRHEYVFRREEKLHLHTAWAGDRSKPLLLMLHGFPECWFAWVPLLRRFAADGDYLCVALDVRGHGESDKPQDVDAMHYERLVQDVLAVVHHFGKETCTLIGHDWGANIAWHVAASARQAVTALVTLCFPHPLFFERQAGLLQVRRSWYISLFQLPVFPEVVLTGDNYEQIRDLYVGSRGIQPATRARCFDDDHVAIMLYYFSKPGTAHAGVNLYRRMFSRPQWMQQCLEIPLECPTLVLYAEDDAFIGRELFPGTERAVANRCILQCIPGTSHWLPHEQPDTVHRLVLQFLQSSCYR